MKLAIWVIDSFFVLSLMIAATVSAAEGGEPDMGLIGHWKLHGDCKDYSGMENHGVNHGADLTAKGPRGKEDTAARFDGRDSYIEIPDSKSLQLGDGDFSISVMAYTDRVLDDVIGDIVSKYDPAARKGFNFNIKNHAGMSSSQSNYRNVHFGIDNAKIDPAWTDCGRPGNAMLIASSAVYDGDLYVGTFEMGEDEAGHVFRYAGGTEWEDCGSPDKSNSVFALAVHKGYLYAGSANYHSSGSALEDSPNKNPGGHVYRYEGGKKWVDCGRIAPDANEVYVLNVFRDELYATPLYTPGITRYDGNSNWEYCGTPANLRSMSLTVFNGHMYAASNGSGGVWRYEGGTDWEFCGVQEGVSQTYSFLIYEGSMYVGTWPVGSVFRYDGGETWTSVGRLGEEKEVMGMALYNGKFYAGTLPLAQVYRYDGENNWTLTGQLDFTPDVVYRRVWTMAVYQGKLFAGTLPSGHVLSIEAGRNATYDYELEPGWRYLTAVREGGKLKLYIDGKLEATSTAFDPADYDISNGKPLKIGFGAHDYFNGCMSDLRIYNRALSESEIKQLGAR